MTWLLSSGGAILAFSWVAELPDGRHALSADKRSPFCEMPASAVLLRLL